MLENKVIITNESPAVSGTAIIPTSSKPFPPIAPNVPPTVDTVCPTTLPS